MHYFNFAKGTNCCKTGFNYAVQFLIQVHACMYRHNDFTVINCVYRSYSQTTSINRILQDQFGSNHHWWPPIELIRRFLLIIFIVIDPGNLVSIQYFVDI